MKNILIIPLLVFFSCSLSKNYNKDPCLYTKTSSTFAIKKNSTYFLTTQSLGKKYLLCNIDSCYAVNKNKIKIFGTITYTDNTVLGYERGIGGVEIVYAIKESNKSLKLIYKEKLGISNSEGKFEIDINRDFKGVYLLILRKNCNPSAISIRW